MTIFKHELKQGIKGLVIWSGSIGLMVFICLLMFPEMKNQMDTMTEMFSNMGSFTSAFGMDKINFGTPLGFYGIECGSILGLGGGFFAALLGVTALSKEEKERTAEFLLTHPISRFKVITEKLLSVITQILLLNLLVIIISFLTFILIGEKIDIKDFTLLHIAYLILQIEIASICFGISAFVKNGSIGIGLGFSAILYFLNIIGNISEKAEFVKYITPFKYSEAADIISDSKLNVFLIMLGIGYSVISILIAYWKYSKKDISI